MKRLIASVLESHGVVFNETTKRQGKGGKSMREVAEVHYPIDVYTLTSDQEAHLLGKLQHYKNRLLYIEGFTDCTGSREYNDKLANNRAKTVAEFLKKHDFKVKVLPSYGKYHTLRTDEESRRTVIYVAEINKH